MLLQILIIGALMGILGQGARAVVGLKSMSDDAQAQGLSPNDLFEAGRLLTSFLIGILVGLASALVYLKGFDKIADIQLPDVTTMLAWAVSAYAGTDFLEGFISQYLSPSTTQKIAAAAIIKPAAAPPAPPPTFSLKAAQAIVQKALEDMGRPPNIPQDTALTDSPIKFTQWTDYVSLAQSINTQLDPTHYLSQATATGWQAKGTEVSDVVHSVQYAPAHPAPTVS
jgi:hypothetical protein